jgi:hypothetical protein
MRNNAASTSASIGKSASCSSSRALCALLILWTAAVWVFALRRLDPHDLAPPSALLEFSRSTGPPPPRLYAFVLRDALRPAPGQPAVGLHVYDYINVAKGHMKETSTRFQLYTDGHWQAEAPCHVYDAFCYNLKFVQTWSLALAVAPPTVDYFFYVEADNDVCMGVDALEALSVQEGRYFLGTGIGASGWLVHRSFVQDLLHAMITNPDPRWGPDVVGASLLQGQPTGRSNLTSAPAWSVTRQYLVSHSLSDPTDGLTIKGQAQKTNAKKAPRKHLPRCREPHRALWPLSPMKPHTDLYGWDYFDYDACPMADISPCDLAPNASHWAVNHEIRPTPSNVTNAVWSNVTAALAQMRHAKETFQPPTKAPRPLIPGVTPREEGPPAQQQPTPEAILPELASGMG